MRSKSLLALLVLVLVASSASAQDYGRPGLYAGVNGVAAFDSIDGVPGDLLDNGIGASGRVGYRFMPMIAGELQVEYSGDFIDCCGADLSETLVTVNGKVYFLQQRFQPYALVGLGGGFVDTSGLGGLDESGFVAKVGGGLDFYINESFGVMFDAVYNIGTGDLDEFNYTSLGWGLFVRF